MITDDTQRSLSFILNVDCSSLNKALKNLIEKKYLMKKIDHFDLNKTIIEKDIIAAKRNRLLSELIKATKDKNIPKYILRNITFLYKTMLEDFVAALKDIRTVIEDKTNIKNNKLFCLDFSNRMLGKSKH